MKWYEIDTSDEAISSLEDLVDRLRSQLIVMLIVALSLSGVIIGVTSLIERRPFPLVF